MFITVTQEERAIISVNGMATAWLRPGRHFVFHPWSRVNVRRFKVDTLVVPLRAEEAALAPAGELRTVTVHEHERALVSFLGQPARWLGVGIHHVLTVDPSVEIELLDVSGVAAPLLAPRVASLAASADYREVTVPAGCVALRHVDGVLDAELPPGRHAAWTVMHQVNMAVVDLRERVVSLGGQEVMTRDRVSLRCNLSAVTRVVDVRALALAAANAEENLHLALQMALRDAITSRTLEVLLQSRDAVAAEMHAAVGPRAAALGMELVRVGIRDLVLPGDIRELMNKVVEAQKAAEANVITRREETAATRSLAQTAALLAENPTLMRLKELETYKELAARVGTIHLVMGGDGALPQLALKG